MQPRLRPSPCPLPSGKGGKIFVGLEGPFRAFQPHTPVRISLETMGDLEGSTDLSQILCARC